jgi:hypothetical protein
MTKKLRIPSIYLRIIKGSYKGYEAEYISRLNQGELLEVRIYATGYVVTVPVEYVVFIMDNNKTVKYKRIDNKLVLVDSKTNKVFTEKFKGINNPNDLAELVETLDVKDEIGAFERTAFEDQETNPHQVTELIKEFFKIIGIDLNLSELNIHSVTLQKLMRKHKNYVFDKNLYKLFVISYTFIYINQTNSGYPRDIPGCISKANDNPDYVICASNHSRFLNIEKKSLQPFIDILLNDMNTRIIPSVKRRKRTLESSFSSFETRVPSSKRRFGQERVIIDEDRIKNLIIRKASIALEKSEREERILLNKFVRNPDDYFPRGEKYRDLILNKLPESYIVSPYIEEYKNRIDFAKRNPKSSIRPQGNSELRENIAKKINEQLSEYIRNDPQVINYILDNYKTIINYNDEKINNIRASLLTENDSIDIKILNSVLEYRKIFDILLARQRVWSKRPDNSKIRYITQLLKDSNLLSPVASPLSRRSSSSNSSSGRGITPPQPSGKKIKCKYNCGFESPSFVNIGLHEMYYCTKKLN